MESTSHFQQAYSRIQGEILPQVCFGKPCVKGRRSVKRRRKWVSLVLDFLASGMSVEEVMEEYDLQRDDVLACIGYGAEMSREPITVEGVVEHGLVRPLDPAVHLPEHSWVIIVAAEPS